MPLRRWAAWADTAACVLACMLALAGPAQAGAASARYCDRALPLTPAQQDRLLRVAELLRAQLQASGHALALVARSGLNLGRFGLQHSHAGISLRDNPDGPWAVRQLYYDCEERRPRLFDQGLAGFVSGVDDPATGAYWALLLPHGPEADALARAALDTPRALALLGGRYNAITHPWSTHSQNCNQWLVEMLAEAWAPPPEHNAAPHEARARAQAWLGAAGYQPQRVQGVTRGHMVLAGFMPLLGLDEHPPQDLAALRLAVSVPASIEAFVRQRLPATRQLQLCFNARQAVLRHGGPPLPAACNAEPGDRVLPLD